MIHLAFISVWLNSHMTVRTSSQLDNYRASLRSKSLSVKYFGFSYCFLHRVLVVFMDMDRQNNVYLEKKSDQGSNIAVTS